MGRGSERGDRGFALFFLFLVWGGGMFAWVMGLIGAIGMCVTYAADLLCEICPHGAGKMYASISISWILNARADRSEIAVAECAVTGGDIVCA